MARRACPLAGVAAVALFVSCLSLASCAGSGGLPYEPVALGTGLTVVSAEGSDPRPFLTVLAERTAEYRGEDRMLVYGIAGRFACVRNSFGQVVAGPGIAALVYVDAGRGRVMRVVVFGDPGPGAPVPVFQAKVVDEDLFDLADGELPRPPRLVISMAGIHSGVDAGPAGRIEGGMFTGAVAVMDLDGPGPLNVIAFEGEPGDAPMEFEDITADSQGTRATVHALGHVVRARDLCGFNRVDEGQAVRLQVDLRRGVVTELTLAPGRLAAEMTSSSAGSRLT